MTRHTWIALAVVAAFCATPGLATAQNAELSLATGWLDPGGEDFRDTEAGAGQDAVVRLPVGERWSLGLGAHWSRHGVDFSDDDYDVVGVFAEPRVLAGDEDSSVRPFLAGRLAYVRESIRVGAESRAASGVGTGILAGLVLPFADRVALEGAVGGYWLSFGDFHAEDRALDLSGGSGGAWIVRIALNLRR